MKVIGVIPARLGASRFPGKPMALLHGMPMVGHCYHRTTLASGISTAYVATCDGEIAEYVKSIGGKAIMTAASHTRATMRTAEAMGHIEAMTGERVDVVVMVQGDEPLIQRKIFQARGFQHSLIALYLGIDRGIVDENIDSHAAGGQFFGDRPHRLQPRHVHGAGKDAP